MASPRNPAVDIATLPLNFTYITLTPAETFTALMNKTQFATTKEYLALLLRYKKVLRSNNPKYNDNQYDEELTQIHNSLKNMFNQILDLSLQTAINSLISFVERDLKYSLSEMKQFKEWSGDYSISGISPLADALVLCNMMRTLNEHGEHNKASLYVVHVAKILSTVKPDSIEMRHLLASAYGDIANAYRRVNEFSQAVLYFIKAIVLWPEANVLNNRYGIYLSKINSPKTLPNALEIFKKQYETAKKEHFFVTPYYLADVYIKLASSVSEHDEDQKKVYLDEAKKAIHVANAALFLNGSYNANYCFKSQARLALLEGHIYSVLGMKEAAQAFYQKAAEYRANVVEPADKKTKFEQKFISADTVFTFSNLFRRPVPAEITQYEEDYARKENVLPSLGA